MTKDSREAYIDAVKASFKEKQNPIPLKERLETPAGKELVAQLESILATAISIVKRNEDCVHLLFATPKDSHDSIIIPLAWNSMPERDHVYSMVRAALIAYDIQSYVTVSEGWSCEEEHYDPAIRNVDNPHRIEVLSVTAVSHDLSIGKNMIIDVDENGDRCVKPMESAFDVKTEDNGIFEVGGTMTSLLPPKDAEIPPEIREMLRKALPFKLERVTESFGKSVN